MFRTCLKIALRNLFRYKGFTLINISGLAIGMAGFILITLYVFHELSYDKFHRHAEHIYRIGLDARLGSEEYVGSSTPGPLVPALVETYPEFVAGTRYETDGEKLVTVLPPGENARPLQFIEENFYYADSGFFSIFSLPLLQGNPSSVLSAPRSVVLTESMARKYFGDRDPVGQTLHINNQDEYTVTGICTDIPTNSHMDFDLLASYSTIDSGVRRNWGSNMLDSYVLLQEGTHPDSAELKLNELVSRHFGPIVREVMGISLDEFHASGNRYLFFLENIRDLHLHSEAESESSHQMSEVSVYILSLIALLILLIACINFMNLTTARSLTRSLEVGMRKVLGSQRSQLILQFLTESVLMSMLALVLAGLLVELAIPEFNNLTGKDLSLSIAEHWRNLPLLLLLGLMAGLVSGIYSALFLSSFKIMNVLKGKPRSGQGSLRFRSGLVIFQFSISVFLIIATLTIHNQIRFIREKDLGYNRDHMLVVERVHEMGDQYHNFLEEIHKIAGVAGATASTTIPGKEMDGNGIMVEGAPVSTIHILSRLPADENFLSTYQIKLEEGRYFNPQLAGDSMAMVINRNTIRSFGIPEPVIGRNLVEPTGQNTEPILRPIIGIIENIHFQSIHSHIRPMGIEFLGSRLPSYISIRIRPEDVISTLKKIEDTWTRLMPDQPLKYSFLDENLESMYRTERKLGTVFLIFSLLAIFIACMGLLGLASFSAERRTKEIGVRKVMGATDMQIVLLLTKDFSRWVIYANFLAWPFAYLFASKWLQNFAYRVSVQPLHFALAVLLSVLIAVGTILFRTLRLAVQNPVDSLRYE
ncbi:MAG TPA: FtsX-like permease family protein [Bacteroidetes bacterium]|nr:FtsX-like permease family protein [Bacteroidota bacterium]